MIRQLNTLKDMARRSAQVADEQGNRFFFSYQGQAGDIARLRHELEDSLVTCRAQSRDPVESSGQHATEGSKP